MQSRLLNKILFSVIVVFVILICCSFASIHDSCEQEDNPKHSFSHYLDFFINLNGINDTLFITDSVWLYNTNKPGINDSCFTHFAGEGNPFFQSFPMYYFCYPKGYLTIILHHYECFSHIMNYVELINYDFKGNIIERHNFPVFDEFGGMDSIFSDYSKQADFKMTQYMIWYSWCQMSQNHDSAQCVTYNYSIDNAGSIKQKECFQQTRYAPY